MSEEEFLERLRKERAGQGLCVGGEGDNSNTDESRPAKSVSDREYYDILGIETNATSSEVAESRI